MSELTIPQEYLSEFKVDDEGKVFASRSATARLCGLKSHASITTLLKNLAVKESPSRPLQTFTGQDFRGCEKLPDVLVSAIVLHYAFKGRDEAMKWASVFNGVGLRTVMQSQLGWRPPEPAILSERTKELEAENKQLEEEISKLKEMVIWLCERMEQVEQKVTSNTEDLNRLDRNQVLFEKWHKEHRATHKELQEKYEQTVRDKEYKRQISLLIAKHCGDNEGFRKASWNGIYGELIRQTEFQVYAAAKMWNCSCIDAVEIGGYMSKLYAIASEVLV